MESEEEEGQEASVVSMATYDDANSSSEYENDVQEVQQPEQGCCSSFGVWLKSNAFLIYCSQFLSAWGDRMWTFAVALFLVEIEDLSLRLTAVFGFALTVSVLLFGTLVGQWVDRTPRLKAARISLVIQNLCVIACAVCLLLLLHYLAAIRQIGDGVLFLFCEIAIIFLGVIANLASVAEKICIQKDWVVILADGNKEQLAVMNANVRRIDLTVNILAPILVGQIMTFASMTVAGIFIAAWNLASLILEYALLLRVYKKVPRLAVKFASSENEVDTETAETLAAQGDDEGASQEESSTMKETTRLDQPEGDRHRAVIEESTDASCQPQTEDSAEANGETAAFLSKINQDEHCVSESTKEQDFPNDQQSTTDAVQQQSSTKVGPCQRFAAIFLSTYRGWQVYRSYPVHLAGLGMAFLYMTVMGFDSITNGYGYAMGLTESTLGIIRGLGSIAGIVGTFTFAQMRRRIGTTRTGLYALSQEIICLCLCVLSIWVPGSPFNPHFYEENSTSPSSSTSTSLYSTAPPDISNLTAKLSVPNKTLFENTVEDVETYTEQSTTNSSQGGDVSRPAFYFTSSILFFGGMVLSRVGLWMFDLVTTQLIQENVQEKERGAFCGMQRALECFMDMLHFILVIILPSPETFGYLIILSFIFICIGAMLYYAFSFKERGHLFHTEKVRACFQNGSSNNVRHYSMQNVAI
ncbi:solute carrier family 40 member 1-like [Asterias rubens]|uniref:solute carrier family 40 member 1-like n=1 Tax=Asterias rubens TaxID=7604 RepID=UPI0014555515|nr:solute carrier family 40 member 1-like [Asterias rubens]XP_033640076.1 solute carrier family 40 member 1-like [Asterias rubens]XP_033640077.1 solute carrier family 40 member 1-like [Asterias rubens]